MLNNHIKMAVKNIVSQKLTTAINISGLSVSFACCLIIALFVYNELSYDRHYQNADRIYRVQYEMRLPDGAFLSGPQTSALMAPLLKQDFPEIAEVARSTSSQALLSNGQLVDAEERIYFADSALFTLFDFTWLYGNPRNALSSPQSIVLTSSMAAKYFGTDAAIGNTLRLENQYDLTVTGVVQDPPGNTHLKFQAVIPYAMYLTLSNARNISVEIWRNAGFQTYVMLQPQAEVAGIEAGLPDFVARYIPPANQNRSFSLLPLADIYMHSGTASSPDAQPAGSLLQVISFAVIGVGILFIAVINFMNISTANSSMRALEIGMCKAVGATRSQLAQRFLVEALLVVLLAMILGLVLLEILLPLVNAIIGIQLSVHYSEIAFWLYLFLGICLLGFLAGSYPAAYLSAFRPSAVLRGEATKGRKGILFRNVLVIFQFAVAIVLIVSTVVVFGQLSFARNYELGFNEENLVNIVMAGSDSFDMNSQWSAMKNDWLSHPDILQVSYSNTSPLLSAGNIHGGFRPGAAADAVELRVIEMEEAFMDTFGIGILAGRTISGRFPADKTQMYTPGIERTLRGSVVLNEAAVDELGWTPQDAIGRLLYYGPPDQGLHFRVVGVAANTTATVKDENAALIYWVPGQYNTRFFGGIASIRLSGENTVQALEFIDETWQNYIPNEPINRWFVENEIAELYLDERRQMQLIGYAALIAIVIACLGLFGLAVFNTARRTKEIGIRKVMGGSVMGIVLLLTNDFSKLVLISNLIAWPVAWFAMNRWLENFAYRIDLTPLVFIGSGLIALCIAWVTVGGTAAKAASAKPVLALRYE